MITIREIAKDYLNQAVNLQSIIKPEELLAEISINTVLLYQDVNNKEANIQQVNKIVMEEFEALSSTPEAEKYFAFHQTLKKSQSLVHFAEVESFVADVKDERILRNMLESAIKKEDLKTVKLLAPLLDIKYPDMLSAMKNIDIFSHLFNFFRQDTKILLSLACFIMQEKIQMYLLEKGIELDKLDFDNPKQHFVINYLKAKEIRQALLSRINSCRI